MIEVSQVLKTVGHVHLGFSIRVLTHAGKQEAHVMCHGYKRLGKTVTNKGSAGKASSPHEGKPARKCHKQLGEKCHSDGFTGNKLKNPRNSVTDDFS